MEDEIKDQPPIGQLPADPAPAAAALEAKQQEEKIEGAVPAAEVPARRMRRTESVKGVAKHMDQMIKQTVIVQDIVNEIANIRPERTGASVVPTTQYREQEIRRLENLQKINDALGELNKSALITRAVGAVEQDVADFVPHPADPGAQGDIVEQTAARLNMFRRQIENNPVLKRHLSLQKSLEQLITGLTVKGANPEDLQMEANVFVEKYLEDPAVPLVEKAVAGPIVIGLRDIFTYIHRDSIPRIIAVMNAFKGGHINIAEAREMLVEEYGYSMLIPKGIKAVCDGFEYCAKGTCSAFKWGGRVIKRGFQKLNIFDAINFRSKFNTYKNTKDFLKNIFSDGVVDAIMPTWLDLGSYSFFKFGALSLVGCAVMKYLLSFFYEVAQDVADEDGSRSRLLITSVLENELMGPLANDQNPLLRDAVQQSIRTNKLLDEQLGVVISQETEAQERTGAMPRAEYKGGLDSAQSRTRRATRAAERSADARDRRLQERRPAAIAAEEQKDSPPAAAPPAAPAVDPRIGVPGFDRFGRNPGQLGFSRGKSRSKPKRKSVRKSNRKSKSKRKSVRKSNRKCKSKSKRKSKRKSVRKSNRKPARKSKRNSKRKSVRKSNRKPARKSKK